LAQKSKWVQNIGIVARAIKAWPYTDLA